VNGHFSVWRPMFAEEPLCVAAVRGSALSWANIRQNLVFGVGRKREQNKNFPLKRSKILWLRRVAHH
jgi:hypothetical protein